MSFGTKISEASNFGMDDDIYWRTLNVFDVQSITFSCEILPTIWSLYEDFSGSISLLDVGTRTGAGTALIGYLHQKYSLNRIKIDTYAIDIDESYVEYARIHYPFSRFRKGDIFKEESNQFDIVLCSHTIEHVDNPELFVNELKRVAKSYVIIACPFGELNLIDGHVNSFDRDFFDRTGASNVRIYKSVTWHQSMACVVVYDVREN